MAETGKRGKPGTCLVDNHNKIFMEKMDADATELTAATTNIANLTDGTTARTGVLVNTQNVGAAGTDVTAVEYGDGVNHTTILTLAAADLGSTPGAGNLAIGALIYTFPAGAHIHEVTYSSVALQGDLAIQADTPDCGIGSIIGTGNIAALNGTTMEDYITGFAATDCNGTADVNYSAAVAGYGVGISLNAAADVKTVHYNAACNWAGATATLEATGAVVLKWTTIV